MHWLKRPLFTTLALVTLLALAACGGGAATPTAAPTEAAAAPTRTPRPTREPVATAQPAATPAPASTDGGLAQVEFGPLSTYQHPTGVFQIDIPDNWELQDNSRSDELILVWTDPTRNGAVLVDIFEDDSVYDADQLIDILRSYLQNSFGEQPDFDTDDPIEQNDGSQLIVWSYTASADNDITGGLLGNSFIEQRGNKVSILTTLVPQDQFDDLVDNTDEIINTYRINTDASLGGGDGTTTIGDTSGLADVVIGPLQTYSHPTGVFRIDIPNNWSLQDNSNGGELILLWTDPTNNAAVIVNIYEDGATYTSSDLIDKLESFLQAQFGEQPDFDTDDPIEQNDGSQLIVWSYTATADGGVTTSLLGNSFIEQRGDKVSILTTLVPGDQFDALVGDTDEIINTYRIDPAASIN